MEKVKRIRTEAQREKDRLRFRKRWEDPEFREKQKQKWKAYTIKCADKIRESRKRHYQNNKKRLNEKRAENRRRNKERDNEYQRKYYERNKDRGLREQINNGKRRRDPTIGLYQAEQDYRNGHISLDELNRLYSDALARVNDRAQQRSTDDGSEVM